MTTARLGYAVLTVQVPIAVWNALVDESEREGVSMARLLTGILQQRYKIPQSRIPKPRRPGRKPKRK